MPCMKCANGKWKYGEHGKCVFDTLEACKAAAAAIHIQEPKKETMAKIKPVKPADNLVVEAGAGTYRRPPPMPKPTPMPRAPSVPKPKK